MIKRVLALVSLSVLLSVSALTSIVTGVFILAGTGAGLVAVGIAGFVLEWLVTE